MLFKKLNQKALIGILLIACLLLNFNTLKNEYALDDYIVMHNNLNVQAGFSGIEEIMKTDAFQGYLDFVNGKSPLTGGRYRPLSIVTFALEQELFGKTYGAEYRKAQEELEHIKKFDPKPEEINKQYQKMSDIEIKINTSNEQIAPHRHFIQLMLYLVLIYVMFRFLNRHIFKNNMYLAFFTTLLFLIHPVHTEVLANVKSRDEIMSLLFIILSLDYSFRYLLSKGKKDMVLFLFFFVLALLSKEYALILPFIVLIGWLSKNEFKFQGIINGGIVWMFLILGFFGMLRFSLFSNLDTENKVTDVLNDPYLYATAEQAFTSKVSIVTEYLRVLFYPVKLSSDYSFKHFTYSSISDLKFIGSLLIYISLGIAFLFAYFRKKEILFPLAIFLGFFMLVNNLLFNIGATMGERLIFHSSFGFCILIIMLLDFIHKKINLHKVFKTTIFAVFGLVVCLSFSFKTMERNMEWKNNFSLFTKDVKTVPNSALANSNAGTEIYNLAYKKYKMNPKKLKDDAQNFKKEIDKAIVYFEKAVQIHSKYIIAYQNLGLCYFHAGQIEKAAEKWEKAAKLYNGPSPFLSKNALYYFNEGLNYGSKGKFPQAIKFLDYSSRINPHDPTTWENLGGANFKTGNFKNAIQSFDRALQLDPNFQKALSGKSTCEQIYKLEQQYILNPSNISVENELEFAYKSCSIAVSPKRLLK